MAFWLDTQYTSGMFFPIGPTGATVGLSGLNDITARVNQSLYFVGADLVSGNSTGSTAADVRIGSIQFTSGVVHSGLFIQTYGRFSTPGNPTAEVATFRIKIGSPGNEADKQNLRVNLGEANATIRSVPWSLTHWETGQDWTGSVNVFVTKICDTATGTAEFKSLF